ncbi:MAG: S-layer homology domain-containing protein [Clostridia bacterium]|nr:S-layer homology domain-containing protein [Clostridia bacterium]
MKTSVRLLAVLFAVIMALCVVSYAADYSDLEASHKNYEAIELLSTLGVLNGYEDGTFRPADPVQRDEMAKMIYIMATAFENAGEGVKIFSDVSAKHWAAGFISWAHGKNIVGGYEDATFRPDANITYDEALKMACCMLGYTDFHSDLWPADVREVALRQLHLDENLDELVVDVTLDGVTTKEINGDATINRAQAAQIIYNCFYKNLYSADVTAEKETLAADVWGCSVYDYKVVATENFGLYYYTEGVRATKTGEPDKIVLWNGEKTETVLLEDWGLEEYEGKTDDIFGFTITEIYKDNEPFAASGLKGTKFDNVTLSWVSAKSTDAPTYVSGTTYWFADRMNVNGTLYEGENFSNLRAVTVDDNGMFTVIDSKYVSSGEIGGIKRFYKYPEIEGISWDLRDADSKNALALECAFLGYNFSYEKKVWGVDSNDDGIVDFLFYKSLMPYKVTGVINASKGEEKYQLVTIESIVGSASPDKAIDSRKIKIPSGSLKEGDVFVGIHYADRLYVSTVIEPVTARVTKISGTSRTLEGVGSVTGNSYFWGYYGTTGIAVYFPKPDSYYLEKKDDGTYNQVKIWIHNGRAIYSDDYVEPTETYKTAVLLYVDKKVENQLDKATNRIEDFYPAYILVNGKEEAINLNGGNAIDGKSGDYVSLDGSEFRAKVDPETTYLEYVYKVVTYTQDNKGYYTLYTENETTYDEEGNVVDFVIPYDESAPATLSYNKNTGFYAITTPDATYKVDIDEETYLYYNYTKKSTDNYVHIGFYTSDSFSSEEFEPVAFKSDVYLAYDPETDFYTLKIAILADEIESAVGEEVGVDAREDARAIYLATANSAMVKYDDAAHYEHTLTNVLTNETKTVVQTELSIADNAINTGKGYYYAWDADADDYVKVTDDFASVEISNIDRIDETRGIIYTTDGSYVDGLKLAEDFLFVAYDDELNRIEFTLSDLVAIKDLFDEDGSDMSVAFMTYVDENDEVQPAYAIVEYAEVVEIEDVNTIVIYDDHVDVLRVI